LAGAAAEDGQLPNEVVVHAYGCPTGESNLEPMVRSTFVRDRLERASSNSRQSGSTGQLENKSAVIKIIADRGAAMNQEEIQENAAYSSQHGRQHETAGDIQNRSQSIKDEIQ
jgi:hypothetical protein